MSATPETLAGMNQTGRRVNGPASDLAELESQDGALYTAIVLEEKHRRDPVLLRAIDLARGFMEFPMVTGLVEMSHLLPDDGAFVYPTGNTRSVAELLKHYRDTKGKFSKRAALELCFLAGQVLQEAAETGPQQGVYSHGDLTPHRLLVKDDGDVQIVGYGIPCPEILRWVQEGKVEPKPESIRYCPPERLQGAAEDVTSDLFSLACIVAELITQQPLFDGTAKDIQEAIVNGQGPQLVKKIRRQLSDPIADILEQCLQFDPRNRYDDGHAFTEAVSTLLEGIAGGESLEEAARPVHERKIGRTLRNVDSRAVTPSFGHQARGRSIRPPTPFTPPAASPQEEQPSADGRWGRASRRREEEEPEEETTSRRRRRRGADAEPEEEAKATQPEEDAGSSRRRRRRRSREEDDAPEEEAAKAAPEEEEEEEDAGTSRRRRRRRTEPEPEVEAKAEPEEEASSSRRRRRRGSEPEAEATEDAEESGSRRRRRRSTAEPAEEPAAEATDDAGDDAGDDDKPRRRRRRRS